MGGGGLIFGGAYIRVEKRVANLGGLYSGELIHGGGGLFTEFYGITLRFTEQNVKSFTNKLFPFTTQREKIQNSRFQNEAEENWYVFPCASYLIK